MVQQLSLFGSIDDDSCDLFVSTMKILSGNPPILFSNLSTMWKPHLVFSDEDQINSRYQLAELARVRVSRVLPLGLYSDLVKRKNNGKLDYSLLKQLREDDSLPISNSLLSKMVGVHRENGGDGGSGSSSGKGVQSPVIDTSSTGATKDVDGDIVVLDDDDEEVKEVNRSDDVIMVDDTYEKAENQEYQENKERPNLQENMHSPWSLSISDIPAAGSNRKVTMQNIMESVLLSTAGKDASLQKLMTELGYIFEYQYVTVGARFQLKHDLVLEMQKVWHIQEHAPSRQVTKGGFLIKAFVNVDKSTDINRIDFAETVLLNLQRALHGYVELSVPDRKAMDSRMDYTSDVV